MPPEIETLWHAGRRVAEERRAPRSVEVSLPHTKYALPTYYIIAPAEASSNLARYDGVRFGLRVPGESLDEMYEKTRADGFGEEVRRRIMIGTYVLSAGYYDAYYLKAQHVRTLIARDFDRGVQAGRRDPDAVDARRPRSRSARRPTIRSPMYLNDVFTVTANLAGLPGISVPGGLDSRRPAARPAGDRPRLRRGDRVPRRRRDREQPPTSPPSRQDTESMADEKNLIEGRDRQVGGRPRAGSPRPGDLRSQAVLRRRHRVRRGAEHAGQPGRCRVARHAAGDQPATASSRRCAPASASRREINLKLGVRPEELLLCRSAGRLSDLAVHAADRRQGQDHARPAGRREARRSASRACTWSRTPARACTTSTRPRPTSISTAPASR